MKKLSVWMAFIALAAVSCGPRNSSKGEEMTVTVTIPPYAWFVQQIAGEDFRVNVLLPPGADHHIWEPLPAQISALSGSEGFIINGQLSFEHAWMDRFLQVNPEMKVLDLSRNIQLIGSEGHSHDHDDHGHSHSHVGPDPHYWMSPVAAMVMAKDIQDFLAGLNPAGAEKYNANLSILERRISQVDSLVRVSLGDDPHRTVLIYHPALAYMGRDYGFEQVSFEDEGKNPSPARMKELIDLAREKEIKIIFIQAEYDVRNAQSLSRETGARLVVINPMNTDWPEAVIEVAHALGSRH
ncbi:MAG: metal ABC transporter solute-binding protein, Zn/Mn family [Actinomycetota bacterium]|jgi:zinc transport system substrate-binding protein